MKWNLTQFCKYTYFDVSAKSTRACIGLFFTVLYRRHRAAFKLCRHIAKIIERMLAFRCYCADDKWYANKRWELTDATTRTLKNVRSLGDFVGVFSWWFLLEMRKKTMTLIFLSIRKKSIDKNKRRWQKKTRLFDSCIISFRILLVVIGLRQLKVFEKWVHYLYIYQVTVLFNHYPLWLDDACL